jgi:hypothetical protein
MTLIGKAIKRALAIQTKLKIVRIPQKPEKKQLKTLLKLLKKAQLTAFGVHHGFEEIINSNDPQKEFKKRVPIFDYDLIHNQWWYRSLEGEENVAWPGKVKYFALSSGTSGAPSKKIPVTLSMIRSIRRTSVRQILSLADYDLEPELFEKGILMIGGSSDLQKKNNYYEGDLSGINATQVPFWFQAHYKPGKKIARERDWEAKLEEIVRCAKDWDIGIVVGVPAWVQIVMERVIQHYNLNTIHDIWPNLSIFVHGGVFFEPYKTGFEKLCARPLEYIETYLASEGFIALQSKKDMKGMELVLNNGIYLEFIPFNESNFQSDGSLLSNPEVLSISEVKEDVDYAIILSTCAGAWRYLIGDTIRFLNKSRSEITITGRTKHYLSLCGEHMSVDNMNYGILSAAKDFKIDIPEFCVAGEIDDKVFKHKWFIGTDDNVDADLFKQKLDEYIKSVNDDYKVERRSALKEMELQIIPVSIFYDWMRSIGKEGGQNKFPRVLKKEQLADWEAYIAKEIKQ